MVPIFLNENHPLERLVTVNPMEASDDALVRAFLSGEKEAFRPLYARYRDRAFFFALSLTFDEHLAEEAVQEAFLAFLRKGRDFVPGGSFRGYLFAAVRSRAIDFLRKAKRDPVLLNGREPSLFESTGRDRTGLNGIDEDGDDRGRAVTRALAALSPGAAGGGDPQGLRRQ